MVRSCHQGSWRLSADRPDVLTRGRYYFVPENTPTYPGWHALGSQYWYDGNWTIEPIRGELPRKTTWDRGDAPAGVIKTSSVGGSECIERGAPYVTFVDALHFRDGFLNDCYEPVDLNLLDWEKFGNWQSCEMQKFYLYLLWWCDPMTPEKFIEAVTLLAQSNVVIDWLPGSEFFPGVYVIVNPEWTVIVQGGTENATQGATQAITGLTPGTDFGVGKTMPLWWHCSTRALELAESAGMNPDKPVLCVGHSYGGAVAHILSARFRAGQVERDVRYLTFASPKPGDARLFELCSQTDGIAIANAEDFIPIAPPDLNDTWFAISPALRIIFAAYWNPWKRPPNQCRLDADGTLHPNAMPIFDSAQAFALLGATLGGQNIDVTRFHRILGYRERTQLRCPGCTFPQELCELIRLPIEALVLNGQGKRGGMLVMASEPVKIPGFVCADALPIPLEEWYEIPELSTEYAKFIRWDIPPGAFHNYTLDYEVISGTGSILTELQLDNCSSPIAATLGDFDSTQPVGLTGGGALILGTFLLSSGTKGIRVRLSF